MVCARYFLLGGFAIAVLWCEAAGRSVAQSLHAATERRWALLASPTAAHEKYCPAPPSSQGVCRISWYRRSRDQKWVDLCAAPISNAKRWYELRLTCEPFGPALGPLEARTRIWR